MRLLGAALGLTLLLVGWWLLPAAGHAVPGRPNDSLLNLWILNWDLRHLFDGQLLNAGSGALEPRSLLRTETLLGIVPLYAPLRLLCPPVLAYNLTVLASYFLSLAAMALLVRRWTGSLAAGLLAGVAYACSPVHYLEAERIQLLQGVWLPLTLWAWERFPARRGVLAVSALLVAQFLASVYLFWLLLWALGIWALADRRPVRLLSALFLSGLVLSPLLAAYAGMRHRWPDDRTLSVLVNYSGAWSDLVQAFPGNLVWGRWLGGEHPLFPGVTVLVLAAVGLASARRERWALLAIGVVALLLYPGPNLHPSPWMWLHDYLPGFALQRAPARYGLLFGFALAGLAGLGARRKPWLLLALVCAETVSRVAMVPLPAVPPIYAHLGEGSTMLELPLQPDIQPEPFPEARRLYFALTHGKRLANGYPMVVSPLVFELALFTHRGPDRRLHDALLSAGVQLVLVHRAELPPEEAALWKPAPGFTLRAEDGPDVLFQVDPPAFYKLAPIGAARYALEPPGRVPADADLTLGLRIQGVPGTLAYQPRAGMQKVTTSWGGGPRLLPHWVFPEDDFVTQFPVHSPRQSGTLDVAGEGWRTSTPVTVDPTLTFGPSELGLHLDPLPAARPGQPLTLTGTLTNRGSHALRAGSLTHNPGLEVWLTRSWDPAPYPLRTDLYPGQTVPLKLALRAPATPGVHRLQLGLEAGPPLGEVELKVSAAPSDAGD